MLPVELWEPNCKSSSLPVDRKYQKGKSRDNYMILFFNLRYATGVPEKVIMLYFGQ
jgi:hypothetical protein